MARQPPKLTPKQQRFVQEYLADLNASAAGLRAGYSHPDNGRQLLRKTHVQDAIAAAQAALGKRLQLTVDDVVQRLREQAQLTGPGSSHSARVAALALLGKHLGMFQDRLQVEGGTTLHVRTVVVSHADFYQPQPQPQPAVAERN